MQAFHNQYMDSVDRDQYLKMFEMLEYDTLYGEDYAFDGFNPFPQTNMTLGLRDIRMNDFYVQGEYFFVKGRNFNEFSEVYVNGKSVKTKYMNSGLLRVKLEHVHDHDEIYVVQAGDDHVVLSITDSMDVELDTIEVLYDPSTEEEIVEETEVEE